MRGLVKSIIWQPRIRKFALRAFPREGILCTSSQMLLKLCSIKVMIWVELRKRVQNPPVRLGKDVARLSMYHSISLSIPINRHITKTDIICWIVYRSFKWDPSFNTDE